MSQSQSQYQNESPEKLLFSFLEKHQIPYKNHQHEPLFTVEESSEVDAQIPGAHTKNLFLKAKSGALILVTLLGRDRLNLKGFEKEIGLGKLSFASPAQMLATLQLTPGSVTPFGLLHESARAVRAYFDQQMMDYELLNFHPLRNDMTTTLTSADFRRFLELVGHPGVVMSLPKKNL